MVDFKDLLKDLKSLKSVSFSLGEERTVKDWLKSGVIAFDWLVSRGKGFPLGRVVEICGDYSAGKSMLAYKLLSQAQKKGFLTVLFDVEMSYDKVFGERCGIDNSKLLVLSDLTVEKTWEVMLEIMERSDVPVLFVWDSIAATPTEKELRDGMDTRDMTKAQMVGKGFRMISQELGKRDGMLILLNQLREKIGDFYGGNEFAPGGRAIDYHVSVKIELKRVGKIVDDKMVKGFKVRAVVSKNRVDVPFRELVVTLRWDRDDFMPWWEGLLDILILEGKVMEAGGWYKFIYEDKKWRASDFLEMLVAQTDRVLHALESVFGDNIYDYLVEVLNGFILEEKKEVVGGG
jgi:recombination protein RecA